MKTMLKLSKVSLYLFVLYFVFYYFFSALFLFYFVFFLLWIKVSSISYFPQVYFFPLPSMNDSKKFTTKILVIRVQFHRRLYAIMQKINTTRKQINPIGFSFCIPKQFFRYLIYICVVSAAIYMYKTITISLIHINHFQFEKRK